MQAWCCRSRSVHISGPWAVAAERLLVIHTRAVDLQAPDAARQTQRSLADIIMEKIRAQQAASGEAPPSECVSSAVASL